MQTLHIISHTHWDREWYKTFQQFRLKLVHLVDNLLTILDSDPTYLHFMLDGQTIVLEDYLQMRMANFPRLLDYIRTGRVLIGPWYILPDEFLVSGESIIRNLTDLAPGAPVVTGAKGTVKLRERHVFRVTKRRRRGTNPSPPRRTSFVDAATLDEASSAGHPGGCDRVTDLEGILRWISGNEALLSGIAALAAIVGLILAPIGAVLRR